MNKKLIITLTIIGSIALTAGIVNAAASHNVTSQFGPAGDIYQVDGTMKMKSVMIGEQDIGGVTYFNGSIVNDTTTSSVDNPVTFGDNVRIDGRVWRGATAGTADAQPFIINDNLEVTGSLTANSINMTVLDNLGCVNGEFAYFGTDGWECVPDYSASILDFIICLDTLIEGQSNVTVSDWNTCYIQTLQ